MREAIPLLLSGLFLWAVGAQVYIPSDPFDPDLNPDRVGIPLPSPTIPLPPPSPAPSPR